MAAWDKIWLVHRPQHKTCPLKTLYVLNSSVSSGYLWTLFRWRHLKWCGCVRAWRRASWSSLELQDRPLLWHVLWQGIKACGYHNMTTCVFLVADPLYVSTVHTRSQGHFWPTQTLLHTTRNLVTYEGCPESICPFWISREPVAWPWCNLAAGQWRPYCASMNSHSRGASQSAVRRRWLSLCTVWPSHSQISSLSKAILALGKARSRREPNLGCRGTERPGWRDVLPKKSMHDSCRMGRRIVVMKLICSLGHCECDGHPVHKLSQMRLTADWLAPRESDCSWIRSKVCSDWLPSYIPATRPVLEIFNMDRYFAHSPRMPSWPARRRLYLIRCRSTWATQYSCNRFVVRSCEVRVLAVDLWWVYLAHQDWYSVMK